MNRSFRAGLKAGSGLAVATFLLAISFGAVARGQGWGQLAPVFCSLVVFSGSAQFALVATLGAGGGALAAVTAAALVNSRFLPMGIAVAGDLRGGRLRRALEGQAVVDGSWAAAHLGGGRFDRQLLFGATVIQWPAWVAGTALGVVLAPDAELLHRLGLDVLTPALFMALLLDEVRGTRANRLPALLGAVIAGGLVLVLPTGPALIGAAAAALLSPRRPAR
ncbi:AzlC family ABC transporter permease [Streptomyces sp. AV19]|uniref:AzlC family ABC transporter permease n=1 Tax=Streptomyces sp. AV19 TaxID=2793068 RepID=UPI0018FEE0D6|nr:AzlC family ABC transporter permease [Streptomyces sp. AV19]MBH1936717.1 AzlC family ABC transporter permease [Streptomyces sp. AV19]MDG4532776.1 AzlC family ABC transporter permease [Streptomyces sp. AV19]